MTFGHRSRWLIKKTGEVWTVYPPSGTFWGVSGIHESFEEARADFVRQTSHVRRREVGRTEDGFPLYLREVG